MVSRTARYFFLLPVLFAFIIGAAEGRKPAKKFGSSRGLFRVMIGSHNNDNKKHKNKNSSSRRKKNAKNESRSRAWVPPSSMELHPSLMTPVQHALELVLSSEAICFVAEMLDISSVFLLGCLNVGIHVLWCLAQVSPDGGNPRDFYLWMHRHFLRPGRPKARKERLHTVLLSAFSHKHIEHLGSNMAALAMFGPRVAKDVLRDRRSFVYFYVSSIFASNYFDTLVYEKFRPTEMGFWQSLILGPPMALGASGAISAVIALHCLEFPNSELEFPADFMGTLDVPVQAKIRGWIFALGSVVLDLFPVNKQDNIGHGSHLGGYFYGALFFILRRGFILLFLPPEKKAKMSLRDRIHCDIMEAYGGVKVHFCNCLDQFRECMKQAKKYIPLAPGFFEKGNVPKSAPVLPESKLDQFTSISRSLQKMHHWHSVSEISKHMDRMQIQTTSISGLLMPSNNSQDVVLGTDYE